MTGDVKGGYSRPASWPRRTAAARRYPRADLHRVLLAAADDVPVRWGQSPQFVSGDGDGFTAPAVGVRAIAADQGTSAIGITS